MSNYRTLIGSLMIGLGIFMTWAWSLPNYQAASALKGVVAEKEAEYAKKNQILEKIRDWNRQYNERQSDIERFQKIVPDKKYAEEAIITLEKVMLESGLEVTGIETAEIKEATNLGYNTLSVTIGTVGAYPALAVALEQIESNIRLMDVVAIEVTQAAALGGTSTGLLNIRLKINTYIAKQIVLPVNQSGQVNVDE